MNLWEGAVCGKAPDPDIFTPTVYEPEKVRNSHSVKKALEHCRRCPVTEHCLREGLRMDCEGVWGGHYVWPRRMGRRPVRLA